MKDFDIRSDIKDDFVQFSSGCLNDLSTKLDEFFDVLKKELFEKMTKKLLVYQSQIDQLDIQFQACKDLVQKHSDLESRSLLQAYTDDLRFCELIKAKHERMKSMRSAQQIKDDFSSFCFTVAKRFK